MSAPSVFTIPPHRGFADALVAGLLAEHKGDPLALARGVVLVPNNRAGRAITDAFVRRAEHGLLLPRIVAIGDPELDERLGALLDPLAGEPIPPAVAPERRLMLLAALVQESRARGGQPVDAAQAVTLAADLARVLDQLIVEGVDPQRLHAAVDPEDPALATHWRTSLGVLEVILAAWPAALGEIGCIDLADRRNRLIARAADAWAAAPPPGFVCAAGINVSAPAIARLLRTIAFLPQGRVVLSALDLGMPAEQWDALGPHAPDPVTGLVRPSIETHPQFHLKLLLDRMSIGRGEVRRWRHGGGRDARAVRTRAIGNAMAPASFTRGWQALRPVDRRLTGVRAAVFATPADEAQAIAVALRQAVETPGHTAALVTPDRALARRVAAHCARWGIAVDDSAGVPLSATPPGTLLVALAAMVAERFAPAALLAVLKHPLVRAGEGRLAWLDGVRLLDRALRGPRPAPGLAGIDLHLAGGLPRGRRDRAAAADPWAAIAPLLRPLEDAAAAPLPERLAALREAAQALGGDAAWSGPAGRAAGERMAAIEAAADVGPRIVRAETLPALMRVLLESVAVRPPQGGHPRLHIWGLLEAHLQQTDLMILGGLNEGVWPAAPAPDPWLAPAIRRALRLPGLERRIGLAAQSFAEALGAPAVLVTRSRRDARAPAVASRLWLRLEAMTGGMTREVRIAAWAAAMDRGAGPPSPAPRPQPAPPVADRPKRIAVTALDRLKADPFAFYARSMLRLSAWDGVDADPGPAWRGTVVHALFQAWLEEDRCDPATLPARTAALLETVAAHPVLRALWTPRLTEAIEWVGEAIAAGRAQGREPLVAEIVGKAVRDGIEIYGTVDRIDRLADGGLAIVDYKTGQPPSRRQVTAGYASQLGLLGLIAEDGGFPRVAGVAEAFEYWSLAAKGGGLGHVVAIDPGRDGSGLSPAEVTAHAARQLAEVGAKWLAGNAPFTARLYPEYAPWDEYDQLARTDEWYPPDV